MADCDDVLGDCVGTVIAYLNERHPDLVENFERRAGKPMTRTNYTVYNLAQVTECSSDRQSSVFSGYYGSRHFHDMPILEGVREGVALLRDAGFEIHLATSRPSHVADLTRIHMQRWGIPIESYNFCGGQSVSSSALSKGDVCRRLEAYAFVDDSAHQVEDCIARSPGTRAFLLDAPWNQSGRPPIGARQPSLRSIAEIVREASKRVKA